MEAVITIVGFLGAGKTTLLKKLVKEYLDESCKPFVVLNDYENASLDSQYFLDYLDPSYVKALSGSCICCSGVTELRNQINLIPEREKGVTLIEANGTTDACELMGFLGVGLKDRFLPPVQISVVDARNWQKRAHSNELEANQVQVSSLVVLNHTEKLEISRIEEVKKSILALNPYAKIKLWDEVNAIDLIKLVPSENEAKKIEHKKTHWSSCSIDLPDPMASKAVECVMDSLTENILRVKGCTRLDDDKYYSFFERIPSGEIMVRPYTGTLVSGPKLLVIGPGSDPDHLHKIIEESRIQT